MPSRVLKWTVPVDDQFHPIGPGEVVHIASQYGRADEVQIWTHEYPSTQDEAPRMVRIFGTGHDLPDYAEVLGSVVVTGGHLVWHAVVAHTPSTVF